MDLTPKDNKVYKLQEYWDSRFSSEQEYDWLATYAAVDTLIAQYVNKSDSILMVGCGNSTFSPDMYRAGYHNITNIDFSSVVIENMRSKYQEEMPEMKWQVADMTSLSNVFSNGEFDVVIDKAAMDALMCDEGDAWSPPEHIIEEAKAMCSGIANVLKAGGTFLQISFGQPHFRRRYLLGEGESNEESKAYGWKYSYHKIDVGLGYFFYVLQKK